MDKVRFNVQQVLTDDVLGIRARVRVRVDEPWATATAKVAEKLRAAAEADGGTEAEGSTEAARYVTTSGAAVTAAEDVMDGELLYALQGGAAVPRARPPRWPARARALAPARASRAPARASRAARAACAQRARARWPSMPCIRANGK